MAETVHLFLTSNGRAVQGESIQTSLGREGSIECISYYHGVASMTDAATMGASGRRQHGPITIRKRIDKASPLLVKALVNNEKVEGTFKFYRPSPDGDGTTEQFYTVTIKDARVSEVVQYSPDALNEHCAHHPPLEEVHFVFKTINWSINRGGASHEDTWGANA